MAANFPSVQRGNTLRLSRETDASKFRDGFPVTLKPSATPEFVVDVQGAANIIAFYVGDFSHDGSSTKVTYPLPITWQIRAGVQCLVEQVLPVFQGVTLFTSADDLRAREGLLVQISGLYAERWTLWTCIGAPPGAPSINCNVYGMSSVAGCAGTPTTYTGSVIG